LLSSYDLLIVFFRVGIDIPKIEVRFEDLSIEGDAYVGTRALPTLLNSTLNSIEVFCSVSLSASALCLFFFFFDALEIVSKNDFMAWYT
jgi:hypothetical protein